MSETAKYRHLTRKYCLRPDGEPGCGVDLASGGDPVVPWAWQLELPHEQYAYYNCNQPVRGPIQLRADATQHKASEADSLDFVYCLPPMEKVTTPEGEISISAIKRGDYVLGLTGFTRVTNVFVHSFRGSIVSLKTCKGTLKVTENHPIATPFGWSRADQLRESSIIIHSASKVEFSQFRDSRQIFGNIGRNFEMSASGPITPEISKLNAARAILHNDASLSFFGIKERLNQRQEFQNSGSVALEIQPVSRFSSCVPRNKRTFIESEINPPDSRYALSSFEYPKIAVSNLNSWNNATTFGKSKAYATLSVNYTSQPCEHQVRLGRIHCVSKCTYNGEVFNLKTEDKTFFANDILTHNCSHLLEDVPEEDWNRVLSLWSSMLKPGGYLIILTPERNLWAAALARGQSPNCSHRYEPLVGDVGRHGKEIGLEVVEDRLTALTPEDYTILTVLKKP